LNISCDCNNIEFFEDIIQAKKNSSTTEDFNGKNSLFVSSA